MTASSQRLNVMIKTLRACFQQLKTLGDDLHEDIGVTASMRAVLEAAVEGGAQTVPQIARAKSVTRQHIQTIVDVLLEERLVDLRDNPNHARSPFVVATDKGKKRFAEMRRREDHLLSDIAGKLKAQDVETATQTLEALTGFLQARQMQDGEADND